MIFVDIALGAAILALLATNYRDRKLLNENKKLLGQNNTFSQYLLGEGDKTDQVPHQWTEPVQDVIAVSKSPVSFDRVVIAVCSCKKCQMVHRYVIQGHSLAKKKGLMDIEGFYLSGNKVVNNGCVTSEDDNV